MAKVTAKSMDLGALQAEYEKSTKAAREATSKRKAAERALEAAQASEKKAHEAWANAEASLRLATKSILAPSSEV